MDKSKFNNKNEWRKFAYALGILLILIGTVQLILGATVYVYMYIAGGIVLLAGLAAPVLIKPLFIVFSYIGFGINWLITRMILTIVFYLVITPIGWGLKITGKKFLDIIFPGQVESYWISRSDGVATKENFRKQY